MLRDRTRGAQRGRGLPSSSGRVSHSSSVPPILRGLRVVELSAFVAAPLAGATLASLGAEVVRVDPPGGGVDANRWPLHGERSLYWAGLNQGKRSVNLDTRTEKGWEVATRLVAAAGRALTNLPTEGWWSNECLHGVYPEQIMQVSHVTPQRSSPSAH